MNKEDFANKIAPLLKQLKKEGDQFIIAHVRKGEKGVTLSTDMTKEDAAEVMVALLKHFSSDPMRLIAILIETELKNPDSKIHQQTILIKKEDNDMPPSSPFGSPKAEA